MRVPSDPPPSDGVLRHLGFTGCVRLQVRVDAPRLYSEIAELPEEVWQRAKPGPVVLASVRSLYAIGYQSATRPNPPEDRPALARLPVLHQVLRESIPAPAVRARIATLDGQGLIPIHTDAPRDFCGTVRLSIQVHSGGLQRFFCGGQWYEFRAGDVWVVDNLRPHGLSNPDASERISVIADYQPSNELVELIERGEHGLGRPDAAAQQQLEALTTQRHRQLRWAQLRYGLVKRWRRYVRAPKPTGS
jgi:hypothetical protein